MNERYIAVSNDTGYSGNFGYGDTIDHAKKNLRKAGGRIKGCRIAKFTSALSFVEIGNKREAGANEADAWIGRDGSVNWVRCEREWLESEATQ